MKIKLVDYSRDTEYDISQDVTVGGVYEVLNEACFSNDQYFEIIDDDGWGHLVLQRDCVIVYEDYKEETEMNIGDRVKFINEDFEWFGKEYIVASPGEETMGIVNVIDGSGAKYGFIKSNLRVIDEEPTEQASTFDTKYNDKSLTINDIIFFTEFHKDLEISFESGKVTVRDWVGDGDPVEYVVEDAEQLKELVDTLESLNKFKTKG